MALEAKTQRQLNLGVDLRIREIRTTIVNIPLVAAYHWSLGRMGGATKVIIEVETNDGVVGLGEAPYWRHAALIQEELCPRLVGVDAYDLRACWERSIPPVETFSLIELGEVVHAFGGLEIALWDIRAKVSNVPLYQLLGGAVRTQVPFTEYFAMRDATNGYGGELSPRDVAAYCARMVEDHDSPFFEGKVGFSDLATDISLAREVRSAIGMDRMLRLDANKAWRLSTAKEALARLDDLNIANVEDPVASYEDMARLRLHSRIPFSTHNVDLRRALACGVPDGFVLNVMALGGIQRTLRFAAACEATGIDLWFYSPDAGIGTTAMLHLAAADPHISRPSQSLLRWHADDVIAGGPFQSEAGYIPVPTGPGLGVELDRDALARCHRRFVEDGPFSGLGVAPGSTYPQLPRY